MSILHSNIIIIIRVPYQPLLFHEINQHVRL